MLTIIPTLDGYNIPHLCRRVPMKCNLTKALHKMLVESGLPSDIPFSEVNKMKEVVLLRTYPNIARPWALLP